jgi:hypothetical protein
VLLFQTVPLGDVVDCSKSEWTDVEVGLNSADAG